MSGPKPSPPVPEVAPGADPAPAAAPPATFTVPVQALSWVNEYLGGPGTGIFTRPVEASPGDTVRDVLLKLTQQYPALAEALWLPGRRGELAEHLEVFVNGVALGVHDTLDSPVQPGYTILLLGQFQGG
jgi:molybdopterin converting factor small subunit